jgi:hypothetical protein
MNDSYQKPSPTRNTTTNPGFGRAISTSRVPNRLLLHFSSWKCRRQGLGAVCLVRLSTEIPVRMFFSARDKFWSNGQSSMEAQKILLWRHTKERPWTACYTRSHHAYKRAYLFHLWSSTDDGWVAVWFWLTNIVVFVALWMEIHSGVGFVISIQYTCQWLGICCCWHCDARGTTKPKRQDLF